MSRKVIGKSFIEDRIVQAEKIDKESCLIRETFPAEKHEHLKEDEIHELRLDKGELEELNKIMEVDSKILEEMKNRI